MSVPLIQQIACIERELKMRRRAYPRWIETQKMTQSLADREIAAMEAVLATLQSLPDEAPAQGGLI